MRGKGIAVDAVLRLSDHKFAIVWRIEDEHRLIGAGQLVDRVSKSPKSERTQDVLLMRSMRTTPQITLHQRTFLIPISDKLANRRVWDGKRDVIDKRPRKHET